MYSTVYYNEGRLCEGETDFAVGSRNLLLLSVFRKLEKETVKKKKSDIWKIIKAWIQIQSPIIYSYVPLVIFITSGLVSSQW